MKVNGLAVNLGTSIRVGDRSRVTCGEPQNAFVGLLFAAGWPGGVNSAAFGVGGVAAEAGRRVAVESWAR
jgi:hypothetical protein